jgi:hypothetical protein
MPLCRELRQNTAQQHGTSASESNPKMEQGLQQTKAKGPGGTVICVRHREGAFFECHCPALAYPLYKLRSRITTHALRRENARFRSPVGGPACGLTLCSAVVSIKVRGGAVR